MTPVEILSNWINNLKDPHARFAFSSIELDEEINRIFSDCDLLGKEEEILLDLLFPIWKRYLEKIEKSQKTQEKSS